MNDDTKTWVERVAELARESLAVQREEGMLPFAFLPTPGGVKVQPLEHLLARPGIERASVQVGDIDSFIRYWDRFSDESSIVFIERTPCNPIDEVVVTGVIDYHERGAAMIPGQPGWCLHTVRWEFIHSHEWATWLDHSGLKCSQSEFAEFIEDNAPDIAQPPHDQQAPDGATLLESVLHMSSQHDVQWSSGRTLQSGLIQFQYREDDRAGTTTIPSHFWVSVCPLDSGTEKVFIKARIRYRINTPDHRLSIWYDLLRPRAAAQVVADAQVSQLRERLGKSLVISGCFIKNE